MNTNNRIKNNTPLTGFKLEEYLIVFLGDTIHIDGTEVMTLIQLRPQPRCTVDGAGLVNDEVQVCAGDA